MLLTIIDVVSCENPECREFARIVPIGHQTRSYYCPTCGQISRARMVDAVLAESQEQYETYLRRAIASEREMALSLSGRTD
mgnify:FL=1